MVNYDWLCRAGTVTYVGTGYYGLLEFKAGDGVTTEVSDMLYR